MKTFLRFLKWFGLFLIVFVVGAVIAANLLYTQKYDAPLPDIHASTDSAVIAHGKHLVIGTAHCVECHFKPGDSLGMMQGGEVELAGGGFPFEFPGGVFYSRNISSDKEFGIGSLSDAQIARALRYGVKSDGTLLIPAMEFQNTSDADLTAIISYLRTVPPVHYKVPESNFNLLGKAILAFILRPEGPAGTPPSYVNPDTTAAYGEYIAVNISQCRGCHTQRDQNTGKYIGEELAGGYWGPAPSNPRLLIYTPNLTPDPETGILQDWDFTRFKNRFSQGYVIQESVMPWGQFKHLNDTELLALWKYLHTLKPVHQDNGPALQPAKS